MKNIIQILHQDEHVIVYEVTLTEKNQLVRDKICFGFMNVVIDLDAENTWGGDVDRWYVPFKHAKQMQMTNSEFDYGFIESVDILLFALETTPIDATIALYRNYFNGVHATCMRESARRERLDKIEKALK